MHHGLGTDGRKIGLRAVVSADFDEGEVGVTGGDGLEGESSDASLPVDSCGVGRTFGGYGDESGAVVAMGDGDELAVAREEVAGVDVDELENGWVELHLQRNGEDVVSVAEHDGNLEGAADGLVGAGRGDGEADGRAGRNTRGLGCGLSCGLAGGWGRHGPGLLAELAG